MKKEQRSSTMVTKLFNEEKEAVRKLKHFENNRFGTKFVDFFRRKYWKLTEEVTVRDGEYGTSDNIY